MPRRREQFAFGSDSFLDVVANIVGILIILIVVAGVRVSRTPLLALKEADPEPTPTLPRSSPAAGEEGMGQTAPPLTPLPPLPEVIRPVPLMQRVRELRERSGGLQASLASLAEQAENQQREKSRRVEDLAALRNQLAQTAGLLRQQRQRIETLESKLDREQQTLAGLQRQLAEVQSVQPQTEALTHRLTPVGRVVTGREVHFRLSGNRVSYVPVTQLAEQLQRDIERRRDMILSRNVYQGKVGPRDGYSMEYIVQRQTNSLLEEVRYGRSVIRMGVTGWMIRPAEGLPEESIDEALQSGSRFQAALRQAGSAATVTLWVYPDSFEIHRHLKSFAHDSGYWVASRPLPEGVPIAGSPQGSKSLAQ